MIDPGLALQGALWSTASADAAVTAAVGARIYDAVPADALFPHVDIGEVQVIADAVDCADTVEVWATLHVWSRAVGRPEAASISQALRAAFAAAFATDSFAIHADWRIADFGHRETRIFLDPDGLSTHAVATFRAFLDPAS